MVKICRYKLPKRAKTFYIHMLNDKPAIYDVGQQICYADNSQPIPACTSWRQIKREQALSHTWRNDYFSKTSPKVAEYVKTASIKYGYLRIRIP